MQERVKEIAERIAIPVRAKLLPNLPNRAQAIEAMVAREAESVIAGILQDYAARKRASERTEERLMEITPTTLTPWMHYSPEHLRNMTWLLSLGLPISFGVAFGSDYLAISIGATDAMGNLTVSPLALVAASMGPLIGYAFIAMLLRKATISARIGAQALYVVMLAVMLFMGVSQVATPRAEELWGTLFPESGFYDGLGASVATAGWVIFLAVCNTLCAILFSLGGCAFVAIKLMLGDAVEAWPYVTAKAEALRLQEELAVSTEEVGYLSLKNHQDQIADEAARIAGAERKRGFDGWVKRWVTASFVILACVAPLAAQSTDDPFEKSPVIQILLDASGHAPATDPQFMTAAAPLLVAALRKVEIGSLVIVTSIGDAKRSPAVMWRARILTKTTADGKSREAVIRQVNQLVRGFPAFIKDRQEAESHLVGGLYDASRNFTPKGKKILWALTDGIEHQSGVVDMRCEPGQSESCKLPAIRFSLNNVEIHMLGVGSGLPSGHAQKLTEAWEAALEKAGAVVVEIKRTW